MKKLKRIIWLVPALFAAQVAYGQLLKVNQTVFGMDCATCAHGVQEGLQKIPGVQSAKISLNDGKVMILLDPINHITLSEIRHDIISNGFSPRDAEVEMKGIMKEINGELAIQVQNEIFWINPNSASSTLDLLKKKAYSDDPLTVDGHVKNISAKGDSDIWQISVEKEL
ncbi:MAG: heavy-metal-associated domain-containing protein [Chitinophagaceae bacterium]|nr:MAG: heavy-metal-associated domain-containing protein [Chitinophagaceae bacterium]